MFFFIEIRKHTGCILLENGAGIAASTPKRSFDMGRLIDRTVDELPAIEGSIMNMTAQNAETGVSASGVFTAFRTGGCARSTSIEWDAQYDSVAMKFGGGQYIENVQRSLVAYFWRRQM